MGRDDTCLTSGGRAVILSVGRVSVDFMTGGDWGPLLWLTYVRLSLLTTENRGLVSLETTDLKITG